VACDSCAACSATPVANFTEVALHGAGDSVFTLAGALTGSGLPQAAAAWTMWGHCRSGFGRTPVKSFLAMCRTRPVTQCGHNVPTACYWTHRMTYSPTAGAEGCLIMAARQPGLAPPFLLLSRQEHSLIRSNLLVCMSKLFVLTSCWCSSPRRPVGPGASSARHVQAQEQQLQ
jgi:hypothetical protein